MYLNGSCLHLYYRTLPWYLQSRYCYIKYDCPKNNRIYNLTRSFSVSHKYLICAEAVYNSLVLQYTLINMACATYVCNNLYIHIYKVYKFYITIYKCHRYVGVYFGERMLFFIKSICNNLALIYILKICDNKDLYIQINMFEIKQKFIPHFRVLHPFLDARAATYNRWWCDQFRLVRLVTDDCHRIRAICNCINNFFNKIVTIMKHPIYVLCLGTKPDLLSFHVVGFKTMIPCLSIKARYSQIARSDGN